VSLRGGPALSGGTARPERHLHLAQVQVSRRVFCSAVEASARRHLRRHCVLVAVQVSNLQLRNEISFGEFAALRGDTCTPWHRTPPWSSQRSGVGGQVWCQCRCCFAHFDFGGKHASAHYTCPGGRCQGSPGALRERDGLAMKDEETLS
jgi:hypothetical protein